MSEYRSVSRERMTLYGDVNPTAFLPWIERHAEKLGLTQEVVHADPSRIDLTLMGSAELIDMMEMGCSLGPTNVWVETVERVLIVWS